MIARSGRAGAGGGKPGGGELLVGETPPARGGRVLSGRRYSLLWGTAAWALLFRAVRGERGGGERRAPGWATRAAASGSALATAADGGAGGDAPTKVNTSSPPPGPPAPSKR